MVHLFRSVTYILSACLPLSLWHHSFPAHAYLIHLREKTAALTDFYKKLTFQLLLFFTPSASLSFVSSSPYSSSSSPSSPPPPSPFSSFSPPLLFLFLLLFSTFSYYSF